MPKTQQIQPEIIDPRYWRAQTEVVGVGLISGTSMDGIDTAVVRFAAERQRIPEVLFFETFPYGSELRELILEISTPGAGSVDQISRANWAVGHAFADAALQSMRASGLRYEAIRFIGSHGQTIQHIPVAAPISGLPSRGTLQIGEPAVIANKTGLVTVADFRAADMAHGGEGAPLAPYLDFKYFAHPTENRILLNIGGIANFTFLPAGATAERVLAFDSGPGNILLDALAQRYFQKSYDLDGEIAAKGTRHDHLLHWLLDHPYFRRPWPKSTGREEFGRAFVARLCEQGERLAVTPEDMMATAVHLTAATIAEAISHLAAAGHHRIATVFVSGGGCRNRVLMQELAELLAPATVLPFDATGISADAKEAVCFASLALATLRGEPGNLPSVTGASRPTTLGKICLPT